MHKLEKLFLVVTLRSNSYIKEIFKQKFTGTIEKHKKLEDIKKLLFWV